MGVNVSTTSSSSDARQRHRNIEKTIEEARKINENIFRFLLLGAAESGKSTILKQMKILHMSGFSDSEIEQQRIFVFQNVLESISTIIRAMAVLSICFEDPARTVDASIVLNAEEAWKTRKWITSEEWRCMKILWTDRGVQACFCRSNEYQLGDSTKYFCDNMDRLSSPSYIPTYDDILHTRVHTTGVVELSFPYRGLILVIIDVGGQRSQRRKWIHCFEGVNSLIFVAALSEYNQVLLEDSNTNRMHEALKLFETVCNCQWFRQTPTILFLNKKDLFTEKIRTFPLTIAFPSYRGPQSYEEGVSFIEKEFEQRMQLKQIYAHRTCATDTSNVNFVMEATFEMVLSKNMKESGFV